MTHMLMTLPIAGYVGGCIVRVLLFVDRHDRYPELASRSLPALKHTILCDIYIPKFVT
jgi:hypothetical protein